MTLVASTQATHLRVESIEDDVLCLRGGQHRAVLEVGSLSFSLQGPAEQEAILASFAAFLNSLTFPIQIVVRVLPMDLDTFLEELEARARDNLAEPLATLARDHCTFVRRLARHRTLLERRFYVVVPASGSGDGATRGFPFVRTRSLPACDAGAVATELTFRCAEVARQLGRCGVRVRRLTGGELAELLYLCCCDELTRVQRLQRELSDYTALVVGAGARNGGGS